MTNQELDNVVLLFGEGLELERVVEYEDLVGVRYRRGEGKLGAGG
jgi:hypothetical protein